MQAKRRTSLNLAARKRIALIAFTVFLLDDLSKVAAIHYLPDHSVRVIGSFLKLNLQFNSGAAFSIATSKTIWLSSVAWIAVAGILYFGRKVVEIRWATALGLVLGGILGNLSDRIFRPPGGLRGQVVDWIQLPHWPTFNLADTSIVIAAILMVYLSARNIKPVAPDEPTSQAPSDRYPTTGSGK
ncbi:MAG: signal peptidase II [Actinomycetes bacterium]|jgi:signal peptidase II